MPTYLIVNRAPSGYQGSPEAMQAWNAWFDQLGEQLVERGNPVFSRTSLGECVPGTALGGYTLIQADSLQEATTLAKSCPILTEGGGVEIGELTPLT